MGTIPLPVSPNTWWYKRERHTQKLSALTSSTSLPSAAIPVVDSFSKVIVLNNSPGEQFRCWVSLILYITVPCNRQRNTNIAAGTSGKWQMSPSSRGMAPPVWSHFPQHHGYIQLIPSYIHLMWASCGYLSSLCQPPKCCSKPHGTRDRGSSSEDHWFTFTLQNTFMSAHCSSDWVHPAPADFWNHETHQASKACGSNIW